MSTEPKPDADTPDYNDMIIVKLEAENIMGLRAVEIIPPPDVVTITGENGAGKSDVINCISMLFGGAAATPPMPVRSGTTRGKIRAEVLGKAGGLVFEKRYKASGTPELTVTPDDGEPLRSPQAVADRFWSSMSDPMKFVRLGDTPEGRRRQAEILREIVKLDFSELDARRAKAYEDRKIENSNAKKASAKLDAMKFEPGVPDTEVSVTELMAQLDAIQKKNKDVSDAKHAAQIESAALDTLANAIDQLRVSISKLKEELKQKESELNQKNSDYSTKQAAYEANVTRVNALEFVDEGPIREKIANLETVNAKVRTNKRRKEIQDELTAADKASEKFTKEIEDIDQRKIQLLGEAPFPVPGLGFDESGVSYNGIPFCQVNTAEQIRIATSIVIAQNPPLKAITIRAGNDLGPDVMDAIRAGAKEKGFQLWIETLKTDDPAAIVIKDGMVA